MVVVYDGGTLARRALDLAVRIARLQDGSITILLPPLPRGERAALEKEAAEALLAADLDFTFHPLARTGTAAVAAAVEDTAGGLLVLGGDNRLVSPEELAPLMDRLTCPLLVVR